MSKQNGRALTVRGCHNMTGPVTGSEPHVLAEVGQLRQELATLAGLVGQVLEREGPAAAVLDRHNRTKHLMVQVQRLAKTSSVDIIEAVLEAFVAYHRLNSTKEDRAARESAARQAVASALARPTE